MSYITTPGPFMGRVLAMFGPVNQVVCAMAMAMGVWGWLGSTGLSRVGAGAVLGRENEINDGNSAFRSSPVEGATRRVS
jgi:hypothetical protein